MASRVATSETRHLAVLQKLKDDHSTKVAQLKEEVKRLEPFKSRAKVLNKEVTKLIAYL